MVPGLARLPLFLVNLSDPCRSRSTLGAQPGIGGTGNRVGRSRMGAGMKYTGKNPSRFFSDRSLKMWISVLIGLLIFFFTTDPAPRAPSEGRSTIGIPTLPVPLRYMYCCTYM